MDVSGISSSAISYKQAQLGMQVSLAVLGKAKDTMEQQGQQLVQMLQQSVQPHLGGNVDIRV